MDTVRTVSDTKRQFYTLHTRPVNSIYRRVVEELMVEMHLLSVNQNFKQDAIYALGVVTSFDRFMAGYTPAADLASIFTALCQAVGQHPEQFRHEAAQLCAIAQDLTTAQLADWSNALLAVTNAGGLYDALKAIAFNENFKYSRLFGIGLYSLVEGAAAHEESRDREAMQTLLQTMGASLHLPLEKLRKDLELYQSNLDKLEQAKQIVADTLSADRKQRQKRETPAPESAEDTSSASPPPSTPA